MDRSDAVVYRQSLHIKYLNNTSDGQTIWTTLTHDQNNDAIAAVNMLRRNHSTKTLTFAVDYLLKHYKESSESKTVEEASKEYVAAKQIEQERKIISPRQTVAIRTEMNRFSKHFHGRVVGEIRSDELRDYTELPFGETNKMPSLKTCNNRRGFLSTFFNFCLTKGYVGENPVLELPFYKIKNARGTAATLSSSEAVALMSWLEGYRGKQNKDGSWWGQPGCMVPYFALTLFAGIRPDWKDGEISRLKPEHIRLDTGVILIEPEVSKVNEKRTIQIQPNLRRWLERYPLSEYPILPKRFQYMRKATRQKFKLQHDVLRHTYISMLVGAYRPLGDASLQAGNSEYVIRKHYLNLKSEEEAKQFWEIVPKGESLPG